jgi:predicted dehydrogenase
VEGLGALERATSGGALVMDIMTGRFEINHIIPTRLAAEPDIFGEFRGAGEEAAISMVSIHHLYKTVNGVPLVRPDWYFDARVQGDGIVDIPSHLADKLLWMMGQGHWDYDRDIRLTSARLWDSIITPEGFTRITNVPAYPEFLAGQIADGKLHYRCNGEFTFDLRGIPARLRAEWNQEAPPGGGDTYEFLFQGTKSQIAVEMGPRSGFQPQLFVRPLPGEEGVGAALDKTLAALQEQYPGVVAAPVADGYEVAIPPQLKSSHEEHFAMVLDEFLGYLNQGAWPPQLATVLRTKYTITARASELARKEQGA